jgi:hypothetical protein
MLNVSVSVDDKVTGDIQRIKRELSQVPKEAHQEFRRLTPIRSGNARRRTYLKGNIIEADYPYAQRLDEGLSRQAPKGIVQPWEEWFRKRINKIMGR